MPEVITLGETMVVFDSLSKGKLRYSQDYECHIGGAETNTAVALVKLNHSAGWISKLGNDEFGAKIKNTVAGEGVEVCQVLMDDNAPTGIFFRQRLENGESRNFYYRRGSAASTMTPDLIDLNYLKSGKILHISGITPGLSKEAEETTEYAMAAAKESGLLVSFDPNLRLKVWPLEQARRTTNRLLKYADIVFPGQEEGRLLYGTEEPDEIARQMKAYGAGTVVVKIGEQGCIGYENKEKCYSKGFRAERAVDTFGAGDAFAAGYLCGVLEGAEMETCLALANAVGAFSVTLKGNIESYPSREELDAFMGGRESCNR